MRRGFTLIELLVVIVIIAILAALISVAVAKALETSRVNSTEAFLAQISTAAKQYQVRWGDWPPSTLSDVGARPKNAVNDGIETLVACLSSKRKGQPLFQPEDDHFCNTDEDQAGKNVTGWFFGDNALREYKDFFGMVISYLHQRSYKKGSTVRLWPAAKEDQKVKGVQSEATKTFRNPGRYQLVAAGPDGKFGTEDDIWPAGN